MSIATGDKKISLRVGGKDLALNEDTNDTDFIPTEAGQENIWNDGNHQFKLMNWARKYGDPITEEDAGDSLYLVNNAKFDESTQSDTLIGTYRSSSNIMCCFGVGASGKNHGIQSSVVYEATNGKNSWMIHIDKNGKLRLMGKIFDPSPMGQCPVGFSFISPVKCTTESWAGTWNETSLSVITDMNIMTPTRTTLYQYTRTE